MTDIPVGMNRNPVTGKLESRFDINDYLTITGSGFGTKTESVYYDDFESRAVGAVSGSVGDIEWLSSTSSSVSTSNPHSGTKSLVHNYLSAAFPHAYKSLTGKTGLTLSCWLHISGTASAGTKVWKMARVGAGAVYHGYPHAGASYTSTAGSSVPQSVGGEIVINSGTIVADNTNLSGVTSSASAAFTNGAWHFYELEFYTGTVDGSDCFFSERVDNKVTTQWVNKPFLTSTNSTMPSWVLTPINGLDGNPDITYSVDEVYISESRSRIIMTDSATYSASTKWCAQEDLQNGWSDTLIYYKPKRGMFTQGDTAYIHVFNNGVIVDTKTVVVP